MDSIVQIAHASLPCDPPIFLVDGNSVSFFADPDGSPAWLAEVTESQAEYFLRIPAFFRWLPAPPAALVPDKTWSIMGIVAYAQEQFGLTINPKQSKDAVLTAALAALAASQPVAPVVPPVDAPAPVVDAPAAPEAPAQ